MALLKAPALAALLVVVLLAGCFGRDAPIETVVEEDDLDDAALDLIAERAAPVPKTYVFPLQAELPPQTLLLEGTVTTQANLGYEDRNDRGGNSYNTVRQVFDLKPQVPPHQPVEMRITLYFAGQPGSSADVDIFVNVPGLSTERATDNNDEFNWKFSVQRMVVNTIALPDQPFEVGVQMSNGRSAGDWPFTLRLEMNYPDDVLAPAVPHAVRLPADATGLILSSEKAGGDEHVKAQVLILDSDDTLVHVLDYNDLDIPTESVFIPLAGGREYVVYASTMSGGFLRLSTDAGVEQREVTALDVQRERVVVSSAATPGAGERDWLHDGAAVTPANGGTAHSWAPARFPLAIEPFIGGEDGGATVAWGEIRIKSPKGDVAWLQRVLRHDDERGSLGYTNDAWNSGYNATMLDRGTYDVWVADVSAGTPVGFVVTTLTR